MIVEVIAPTSGAQELSGFGLTRDVTEKRTASFCRLPGIVPEQRGSHIWVSANNEKLQ